MDCSTVRMTLDHRTRRSMWVSKPRAVPVGAAVS